MRPKELVICGMKAVRSRFEVNSNSVKRLFFNRAIAPSIADICRWMAAERLVYRCVENEELEQISGSIHHGGIAVVVDAPQLIAPRRDEVSSWASRSETILILDRIGNVHNLGAIIRSAAYFGVTKLVLPNHPQAAVPTEATYRVAEGALDHVNVFCVDHLPSFVAELREFHHVIGSVSAGGMATLPQHNRQAAALIMGNEEQGLSPEIAKACHSLVTIPGSGLVESLNVSAAATVLLWEMTRSRLTMNQNADTSRLGKQPQSNTSQRKRD